MNREQQLFVSKVACELRRELEILYEGRMRRLAEEARLGAFARRRGGTGLARGHWKRGVREVVEPE